MNSYSLGSDSRRWWWPSATAGALATAAVGAILVLPSSGTAAPVEPAPVDGPATIQPGHDGGTERQCFMWQGNWNDARSGPQPVCYDDPEPTDDRGGAPVVRPGLPLAY